MSCTWERHDCKNQDVKCHLCFVEDQFYVGTQKQTFKKAKPSARKGAVFEANNSNLNNQILLGGSAPTPNSGAGTVKGDEQIKGLINIMEELKEQNQKTSRGSKTFTIHKEWLEKLEREAQAERHEFFYLKFCFGTEDAMKNDYFVVIDGEQLMSMVKTMWEDRKVAKIAQSEINVAVNRKTLAEQELVVAKSEIAVLKSEIELLKNKLAIYEEE